MLGTIYHASQRGAGNPVRAQEALAHAVATDPDIAAAARARLAELTDDVCIRDHVSKVCRAALERALKG